MGWYKNRGLIALILKTINAIFEYLIKLTYRWEGLNDPAYYTRTI